MRIQHNIMAMNAYRNYTNNVSAMKGNLEKLSSGYKINRAGDDAAGLAISEKMRAQITGLQQAQANAKSGINLVQTAEGALQEVQDMLNRMVKLAEQSANGTFDDGVDRNQLQKEFQRLTEEIDRIGDSANFNGITLLDGSLDGGSTTSATKEIQEQAMSTALDALTSTGGEVKGKLTIDKAASASTTQAVDTVKVEIGGKSYDVADTNSTVKAQADAWCSAFNDEHSSGDWVASADTDGNITIESNSTTAGQSNTSGVTGSFSDANGTDKAKVVITKAAAASTTAGTTKTGNTFELTIGGKKYNVTGTDVPTQAAKWVDAYKKDTGNAAVVAAYDIAADALGNITFTQKTAADAATTPTELAGLTGGTWTAGKAGTLDANQTVTVGGVDYKTKAGDTKTTALKNAVDAFNADATASKDWTASVGTGADDGKVIFTAKTAGVLAADVTAPTGATQKTAGKDAGTVAGAGKAMNLQIGDTAHIYNRISVSIKSIKSDDMYDLTTQQQLDNGETVTAMQADGTTPMTAAKKLSEISVDTEDNAREALGALKGMVNYISDIRGELGATQNRLNHTINNLSVMTENIQDAESTIRDTDVADEMMAYTKNNILIQSAQAMLAQANQVPQGVLQLLQ